MFVCRLTRMLTDILAKCFSEGMPILQGIAVQSRWWFGADMLPLGYAIVSSRPTDPAWSSDPNGQQDGRIAGFYVCRRGGRMRRPVNLKICRSAVLPQVDEIAAFRSENGQAVASRPTRVLRVGPTDTPVATPGVSHRRPRNRHQRHSSRARAVKAGELRPRCQPHCRRWSGHALPP